MEKDRLTRSQLAIMKCVWDNGEDISYQDLITKMENQYGHEYHRSTIVTFLQQLEGKGYITTYRIGRYAYVKAVVEEEEFKRRRAVEETSTWFHGKAANFLVALHEAGNLNEEDRAEIRRLLDELDD